MTKIGFQVDCPLMQVKSIAECSKIHLYIEGLQVTICKKKYISFPKDGFCLSKSADPEEMLPYVAFEPRHEISNNVVGATSKASDQPAHMRSLIRAFACRLNIL